ncbi:hypothetical protein [Streptomyces bambusae]|uniref:Secreted protein n=1 Tax=Streptomyces bambusae TaxID=1550616 RepID=A0ABS6ZF39_9ACTN|nr:hypothetical protein [Streptomyces bambusae]MBW5486039.1 hypothetical protein [Streptomyces bambusae]
MRTHLVRTAVVALAAAATVVVAGTPSSAATEVPWSASHGTASASGTRWTERPAGSTSTVLVVKGELRNTGSGCYAVWSQFTFDFMPRPARKHASLCGPGAVPVEFSTAYSALTTGSVFICKGDTLQDCGERRTLTSWPVQAAATAVN